MLLAKTAKKGDIQILHNNILSYGFLMALGWFPFGLLASDEQILQKERIFFNMRLSSFGLNCLYTSNISQ